MKEILMDPLVAGPGIIIIVGLLLLMWALKRLFSTGTETPPVEFDFPLPRPTVTQPPLSVVPPVPNPFAAKTPPTTQPAVSRDVVDKVDLISQRLTDMQMLLNKQLSAPPGVTQGGGGAPTLSPEMLDKLIKITATVAQQVEVLQKSLATEAPLAEPTAPVSTVPTL